VVDFVRSCRLYTRVFQLPGGLTTAQWYERFAAPGALPFGHSQFGSPQWEAPGLTDRPNAAKSGTKFRWICGTVLCGLDACHVRDVRPAGTASVGHTAKFGHRVAATFEADGDLPLV